MTKRMKNGLLIAGVVLLSTLPLLLVDGEFGGADGAAEDMIRQLSPAYELGLLRCWSRLRKPRACCSLCRPPSALP